MKKAQKILKNSKNSNTVIKLIFNTIKNEVTQPHFQEEWSKKEARPTFCKTNKPPKYIVYDLLGQNMPQYLKETSSKVWMDNHRRSRLKRKGF
jgi:hypothetical protein